MRKYNPNIAPNPKVWNDLDEMERQLLVEKYHKQKKIRLPNSIVHATFHDHLLLLFRSTIHFMQSTVVPP